MRPSCQDHGSATAQSPIRCTPYLKHSMKSSSSNRVLGKPYTLLLIAAVLVFFLSFILTDAYVDFHIHDTMVVVSLKHIQWLVCTFFLFEWFIYILVDRLLLSKYLIWLHVFATILAFILILVVYLQVNKSIGDVVTWDYIQAKTNKEETILLVTMALLTVSHLLFAFNLIAGLVRRRS